MRHLNLSSHHEEFKILAGTAKSQAAAMEIAPGEKEGGADNQHPQSDQWLFVISGAGQAIVKGKRIKLKERDLLLIEAGETHEIINTGSEPLHTVNFYAKPAY